MANGKKQHATRQEQTGSSKRSNEGDNQSDANGEQPAKRSRVSRACDQCRSSRERCDGSQPECRTCTSQNRTCSYKEQPKKRGIQPNYIRTLELTLAWIFQSFPEAETRLSNGLPVNDDEARRLIGANDAGASEALHNAWRDCLINKQIEQMLSGATIDRAGQAVDENASTANVTKPAYNSPPLSAPSEDTGRRQDNAAFSEAHNLGDREPKEETRCQLPEDPWQLLEHYFAFTHSWLPMAERSSLLKTMYSYPTEGLPRSAIAAAEHAELWAIMALASAQRYDEMSRKDIQWTRQLAESLVPAGNSSFELPHIRASIILAILDVHDGHMLAAWLRIGGVARLLYLFKLLQSLGQTTKWCRHIHLVAFVLESALALHLDAPGHLTSEYISSVGFVDEDGMEEWTPWQDPSGASQHGAKAPARSFSTLNELVRRHMNGELTQQQVIAADTGSTKSIVFDLIRNAALKRDRVQPSALVTARSIMSLDWPSSSNNVLIDSSADLFDIDNSQPSQVQDLPNARQNHPFMSIPNEPVTHGPGASPATAPSSSALWNTDISLDLATQPISPEAAFDGASADIFEELANLERQDSIQQPQFMRNLGFAPDLDLAEFFGDDYQPSDPLLAYLQPSGYTVPQQNLSTGGYK